MDLGAGCGGIKNTEAMNIKLYNMLVDGMKNQPNNIIEHYTFVFHTNRGIIK